MFVKSNGLHFLDLEGFFDCNLDTIHTTKIEIDLVPRFQIQVQQSEATAQLL